MISVRPYNQATDYSIFAKWWEAHGFGIVPANMLPMLGIVALYNGQPVAAAWVYLDNSTPMGLLEWIVTNPENRAKVSAIAITRVVEALREAATELGHTFILSSCRQQSLANLLQRIGFQETDKEVIHLLSITQPNPAPES